MSCEYVVAASGWKDRSGSSTPGDRPVTVTVPGAAGSVIVR